MSEDSKNNGILRAMQEDPEKTLYNDIPAGSDAATDLKDEGEESPESDKADDSVQESPSKRSPMSPGWKAVTIGGVSGIMLGVAPYALGGHDGSDAVEDFNTPSFVAESESDAPVQATTSKDGHGLALDDMSFGQAFAAARSELGSGRVFEWRGALYSTYTKEEWEEVYPLNDDDVIVAESDDASVELLGTEADGIQDGVLVDVEVDGEEGLDEDVYVAELDDDEVGIVDVETAQAEDGEVIVATLSDEGNEAVLVDTDGDGSFDAIAADFDGDGSIAGDELFRLQGLGPGLQGLDQDDFGPAPDPSADMDF